MNHHISRRTLRTTRLPILFKLINCHLVQEINFEEFTRANGRYYHPEHFQCWQCAVVLSGEKYYGCGVYPMCLTCYDVQLAKPCRCCKGAIQVCVILSFFFQFQPPPGFRITSESILLYHILIEIKISRRCLFIT